MTTQSVLGYRRTDATVSIRKAWLDPGQYACKHACFHSVALRADSNRGLAMGMGRGAWKHTRSLGVEPTWYEKGLWSQETRSCGSHLMHRASLGSALYTKCYDN